MHVKTPPAASVGAPFFLRSELLLEGDESRCLAREADSLPCLVDVARFNRRVLTRKMFEKGDPEPVRATVIREALDAAFWARKAREAGLELGAHADSEVQADLAFRKNREAKGILAKKEFDDAILRRIYDQQYQARFMAARDARLRILGSTDSMFLDTVARGLRPDGGGLAGPARLDNLPWTEAMASSLPAELAEAADSLVPGKQAMVSAVYGHFLLDMAAWVEVPEEPFEAVRPLLRETAIREDPDLEYRAMVYWQDHRREFLSPDTLMVKAWLNPSLPKVREPRIRNLSERPFLIRSYLELPEMVRAALPDSLPVGDTLIGPVRTPLGVWYFQPLSRKPGGRPLPFRAVRERIKEMVLLPAPELYQSLEQELKVTLKEDLLALAFLQRVMADSSRGRNGTKLAGYGELFEEKALWLKGIRFPFRLAPEPPRPPAPR
ncbi:MAG TPA: hypothetical protein VJ385_14430 [Fibrobacteria bacterium]|nr:hypothetical protein [Fibrobacteria bacterium]